jgi:hypothetical protein
MNNYLLRTIQKSFLALVLALSTLSVVAQNTDPSRWEETMAGFERQDRLRAPPENAILLTGSSSIARWNNEAAAALAPLTVIPRGFGGSVMGDVLYHLDRVALRYKPRAILIYEGDNDTSYGIPVEKIIGQFEEIVTRIHAALPQTRIYVLSVKPSVLRANVWNEAQQVSAGYIAIAERDPLVHYVDVATPFLWADGTVMEDVFVEDNLIWGSAIRAALMPLEARYESAPH